MGSLADLEEAVFDAWAVALPDAMLAHDVQDGHSYLVPVPAACQSSGVELCRPRYRRQRARHAACRGTPPAAQMRRQAAQAGTHTLAAAAGVETRHEAASSA